MDKKKLITFLLALTMILSLAVGASAAETTEARVPVTLTVVNTVSPISCTVPAALPVSLVDGYVVCANNAAITNTGKTGAIRVTKVDLMYVTKIAGAIISRKKSAEPAAAPAAAPAAPAVMTAPAPGTAGKIALHDVPDKTAAMLMAIVASKTGKPLNQLRFISIREIKD